MPKMLKVKLTLQQEMLGGLPGDDEVYDKFIASKAPDAMSREEEVELLGTQDVIDKGTTRIPRDKKGCFLYNYQIEGFFKAASRAMKKTTGSVTSGLKSHIKTIDTEIFVKDRRNYIGNIEGEGYCQRSLRASTPMGERVSIAKSETVSAGSTIEFTIIALNNDLPKYIEEWLDYGVFVGLGQWRNSGKGSFTWEKVEDWKEISFADCAKMKAEGVN